MRKKTMETEVILIQPDLRLLEATLRRHPGVADCAILTREIVLGGEELIAYVVPTGPFVPERFQSYLQAELPLAVLPSGYVPVASLPLNPAGHLNQAALTSLEIVDVDLVKRWEKTLLAIPGIDEVAVVVQQKIFSRPSYHLADLIPGWKGKEQTPKSESDLTQTELLSDRKLSEGQQLSYSDGGPLFIPSDAPKTLTEALLLTADRDPNKGIFYVQQDGSEVSQLYPELLNDAKKVLAGLYARGLKPKDCIILQLGSMKEHFTSFWACVLGGIIPVTVAIAPSYREANAVVNKLYNTWELLKHPKVLCSKRLISEIGGIKRFLPTEQLEILDVEELKQFQGTDKFHPSCPTDTLFYQLTSGSTGIPKCIQVTHHGVISHIHASQQFNEYSGTDVTLNWLPVDHVVPILTVHLKDVYLGCREIQVVSSHILSQPLNWLSLIESHRVTHSWAPNFGFKLVTDHLARAKHRHWDLSSVKILMNAGEQVTLPVLRGFLEGVGQFGVKMEAIQPAFGMAEACTCMTYHNHFNFEKGIHRVLKSSLGVELQEVDREGPDAISFVDLGPPVPGVQIRITDEKNQLLAERRIGRFQIKGAVITPGYLHNEEANRDAFVGDGWFNSGDLGFIQDGRLTLTGREKEMIIVRGANYYCYEIEDIVNGVAGVEPTFAAACAVEDRELGTEGLAIFFVPRGDDPLKSASLVKAIRMEVTARLGISPAQVIPITRKEFPKTTSGKIQRTQLKKALLAGHFENISKNLDVQLQNANSLPDWFFETIWRPKQAQLLEVPVSPGCCLIFLDSDGLGTELAKERTNGHCTCILVESGSDFSRLSNLHYRLDPRQPAHFRRLFQGLAEEHLPVREILHLWTYEPWAREVTSLEELERAQDRGIYSLLFLAHALSEVGNVEDPVRMLVVSSYSQPVSNEDPIAYEKSPLVGLLKSLSQEQPYLDCRHIDLPADSPTVNALRILQELQSFGDREVAYRLGQRLIPRLEPVDFLQEDKNPLPFRQGGIYLISGGLGGIGIEVAKFLLKEFQAKILIVGRTPLPERPTWEAHLRQADPTAARIFAFQTLEEIGEHVHYEAVDVADQDTLFKIVERQKTKWDCCLEGVIHLAGVYQECMLAEETRESLAAILRPKLMGTWALHQLVRDNTRSIFINFSSVLGYLGGAMFGAYTAANHFLDCFGHFQRQRNGYRCFSLAWSAWEDLGMSRSQSGKKPLRAEGRGINDISKEQGLNSLLTALHHLPRHLLIGLDGSKPFIRRQMESEEIGIQQVHAYFTVRPENKPLSPFPTIEVLDRCGTPSTCDFTQIREMPRVGSGEIDLEALANGDQQGGREGIERVLPRSDVERRMAEIWQEVLGLGTVGIHDNFFELGGHSLLATQVVTRLHMAFGVDLPLSSLFEAPTIESLANRVEEARKAGLGPKLPSLISLPREGHLPLSFAQERLWFMDQLMPGSSSYNLPCAYRLAGPLNVGALKASLSEVVRRHEILRTTFLEVEGKPVQIISSPQPVNLDVWDLSSLPQDEREAEALRQAAVEVQRPFDFAQGPLMRSALLRLGEEDHLLVVTMHHIISDGWSLGVFNRELAALYGALSTENGYPLPELPIQYADYALWQRQGILEKDLELQLAYWKRQLKGLPTLVELPLDWPRPPVQSFRGAHLSFVLPKKLSQELKALSRDEGTTLFVTLMAAFQVLLHRYTGQDQFLVSTGVANRNRKETEPLIGCLINIILLRADLSDNPKFREHLARVREVAVEAFAHQDFPFEQLVKELQPQRDLSYNPLTQVMFVLLTAPMEPPQLSGLRSQPVDVETVASPYDLVLHMLETPEGLAGYFDYSTDLFAANTINRFLGHFLGLLEKIVSDPQRRVLDLPLLSRAEQNQMILEWNKTVWTFPSEKCLHELFEIQAENAPGAVAVIFGEETLSYCDLELRSNQLAQYLRKLGVGADVLVGLCVERSIEMVVGMLGIMKAGGAYVPLDPNYPQERLSFMVDDVRASVVLTQERLLKTLSGFHNRVICLDTEWEEIAKESGERPIKNVAPLNLCYVIFTSGSTGTPKGIALAHRGVVNNITDLNRRHGVGPTDRMLALSSISFDMCVYEVFGTLDAGGAIVMPEQAALREPKRWAELMQRHGVTVWNSAPALLKMFVDYVSERRDYWPHNLHLAILGGDWVPVTLPNRLKAMAPKVRFIVLGGATEASIHSIIYAVERTDPKWKSIPYGKPQYNQKAYILNPSLEPVPVGVVGELYIGGIGLGRGYFNRPGQTAERFLPNPFAIELGERIYRTGDLARYLEDGTIELIGRVDFQVKLRGLRVECGEIEAVIRRHQGVQEAVVAVKEIGGDKRLVAYIKPNQENAFPVCQMISLEKNGFSARWQKGELPNGMPIIYCNKAEIEFSYREIFEESGYLRNGITLQRGDCVFDVGANIGLFALHIGLKCPGALIYAVEPIPPVFDLLRANTTLHGTNVRLINCGLSSDSGEANFTYYPHLSLISSRFSDSNADRDTVKSYLSNGEQTENNGQLLDELLDDRLRAEQFCCPLKTLSQIIRENNIQRIDLLKIDVEKGELDVLNGIVPEDWAKIRQLIIEVYDLAGRVATVTEMLRGRGYRVTVEQDNMLTGTLYRNVFAVRPNSVPKPVLNPQESADKARWQSKESLVNDIRGLVKEKLPDYMVPAAFVLLDELPLSPNGKVDRKALPLPHETSTLATRGIVLPRTPDEEILAGICAQVLGIAEIGIGDDFFELGGHSLLATQVISRVRQAFHVELPLQTLFASPTVAGLAERIVEVRDSAMQLSVPPLIPIGRTRPLPLSFTQQALWFIDQLMPGSPSYNIPLAFRFSGVLNEVALEKSLGEILHRHEVLRTTIVLTDGQPQQCISEPASFRLPLVDLRFLAQAQRDRECRSLATAEARLPFDLANGLMVRASLLRLEDRDHLLLLTLHHIVSDGWSLGLFIEELGALYNAFYTGNASPLPDLPIQYADYAIWQRNYLQGRILEEQVNFWKEQLAGVPPTLDLPADHPRPAVQTLKGARYYFNLPPTLIKPAEELSRQEKTTLFVAFLASFNAFLFAYTGKDDLVVGTPFANRGRTETEKLIGPFVNTLVLRTKLAHKSTFRQLLRQVRNVVLGAERHQDLPFQKIVEVVRPPRDLSRNPVFQVNFRANHGPLPALRLPGITTSTVAITDSLNSKFDLALEVWFNEESPGGFFEYSTDLFEETTIRRICGEFEDLLKAVFSQPEVPLCDLAVIKGIQGQFRPGQVQKAQSGHPGGIGLRGISKKAVNF